MFGRSVLCVVAMATLALAPASAAPVPAPTVGDTSVFARIGDPGMPEGIAIVDGRVYVGTHASVGGNGGLFGGGAGGPSGMFVFDVDNGSLVDAIAIAGQARDKTHGLVGLAFDAAGRIYALDRSPSRIIRIDPVTHDQQTYATIPELVSCATHPQPPCSPTVLEQPNFPDYLAFTTDGTAYVTDLQAATIFRVPAGGGVAEVWYQDERFDGLFGVNGIAVSPDGTSLVFAMTGSQQPATLAQGIIYRLPIVETPTEAMLEQLYVYDVPASGPDGIRFGASGKLYVALAGTNQISILDLATGDEMRFPPDPIANEIQEIPYDMPASIDFDDARRSILFTNHSYFTANPNHWAVLRVFVDDVGLPLIAPDLP